ncbi:tripartite tricarboxylate transporter permease [Roseococcus thiosulfatophilus]|uniref:tripartite tricarboxylate transporter permease n=1 Tax=Roseococcus thiosulfatophilus TaxID=35813 RepID=UPI001A8C5CC0|nr:tripartite tricarboxylate transporter permease [Roseococcus thiosulfatophilus]
MWDGLLHAIPGVFAWQNVLAMVVGTIGGIVIGALPGLSATMGIAVLIPLTFGMEPLVALGMMAGIYNGAMYGGAIPAVLLRIPGTPAAVCTTLDGYPMAQRGDAARALQISCLSSAVGGMASAIALIALAPPLVQVTLLFGPAEYFWVAVFGLCSVSVLLGKDPVKGLIAACFGLLLGTVGIDGVSGHERFTFDDMNLAGGLHVVVVLTGLYALPPIFMLAEEAARRSANEGMAVLRASVGLFHGWTKFIKTWIRSSLIGIVIGILPGAGGSLAAFLSYNEEKRASKDPDSFGQGNENGVAAAECGNNADNAAALIPALTLGIPGSAVTAIILGGLLIHGLQPGPALFRDHGDVVYGFMIQMLITSVLIIFFGGVVASRLFANVLRIPSALLAPCVLGLCVVGVYSVQDSMFDVYLMFGFGLIGYAMDRLRFPLAPVVLGVVLGGMAESNLRLALIIAQGDYIQLVSSVVSQIVIAMILVVLAVPLIRARLAKKVGLG